MRRQFSEAGHPELVRLRRLTAQVGADPLLTQASTGNSSMKLDGVLWIKASGNWMADALDEDILIPLPLERVIRDCYEHGIDPAGQYPGASIETAMHAVLLTHRVVLHLHSVNTIAWAVQKNAPIQLQQRLDGLNWQWVPYVPSGLPLASALENALFAAPDTDIFVLGNHGLVIGGEDCSTVRNLLVEVEQRLSIRPRRAHPADYADLDRLCQTSSWWELPDDDDIHALGTDAMSQAILSGGLLYPCQAIFCNSSTPDLFKPIPAPDPWDDCLSQYSNRPFLIVAGLGVLVSRRITTVELAMIGGLAQIIQRVDAASSPLRYLAEVEFATACAGRYRELANGRVRSGRRIRAEPDLGVANLKPRKLG